MTPEWRPVLGWEGLYSVSSEGQVFNHRSKRPLGSSCVGSHGYRVVSFIHRGQQTQRTLHTVVAEAFLGMHSPDLEVRHMDGDKLNCRADNLQYGTSQDNKLDRNRHGWAPARGPDTGNGRKSSCPLGHQLIDPNLRKANKAAGKRGCRSCHQASSRVTYWAARGVYLELREVADEAYRRLMPPVA